MNRLTKTIIAASLTYPALVFAQNNSTTTTTQQAADAAKRQRDTGTMNENAARQMKQLDQQEQKSNSTPPPSPSPTPSNDQ